MNLHLSFVKILINTPFDPKDNNVGYKPKIFIPILEYLMKFFESVDCNDIYSLKYFIIYFFEVKIINNMLIITFFLCRLYGDIFAEFWKFDKDYAIKCLSGILSDDLTDTVFCDTTSTYNQKLIYLLAGAFSSYEDFSHFPHQLLSKCFRIILSCIGQKF